MSLSATRYQNPAARVLIPALAFLMLLASGCSDRDAAAPEEAAQAPAEQIMEPEAAPPATAPESVTPEAAAPAPAAEEAAAAAPAETLAADVDGQKIYQTFCQACHAAGVAGAPKTGDKDAWAPRIAKGTDAMVESVKNGLNAMPPKGACMTCSDEELRAAVLHLVEQGS